MLSLSPSPLRPPSLPFQLGTRDWQEKVATFLGFAQGGDLSKNNKRF